MLLIKWISLKESLVKISLICNTLTCRIFKIFNCNRICNRICKMWQIQISLINQWITIVESLSPALLTALLEIWTISSGTTRIRKTMGRCPKQQLDQTRTRMRRWQVPVPMNRSLGQDLTYACKIPWSLTIVKNSIWAKLPLHKQTRILQCSAAQIRALKGMRRRVKQLSRLPEATAALVQCMVHRVNSKHLSQSATTVLLVKSIMEVP